MHDAELIQDAFAHVSPAMHEVAERFYQRLFARQPRLRALFPDDMKSQADHFAAAIAAVVGHAHDLSEIDHTLRDMGARHVRYGATPELYDLVSAELVGAVGEVSEREQPGSWTPAVAAAWARTLNAVAAAMLRGAEGARGHASA